MGKKEEWIFMGMKRFMGKYPTLSPLGSTLPYPTREDWPFYGQVPYPVAFAPTLPYPTRGDWPFYGQVHYPVAFGPYPTLP